MGQFYAKISEQTKKPSFVSEQKKKLGNKELVRISQQNEVGYNASQQNKFVREYNSLNKEEKMYVRQHPWNAVVIRQCKTKAWEETKKRFGYNRRNDASDAFRHCYWTALIAHKMGKEEAIHFTTIHEEVGPQEEKEMDLHNNKIGAGIGAKEKNEEVIADQCVEALRNKNLKVLE